MSVLAVIFSILFGWSCVPLPLGGLELMLSSICVPKYLSDCLDSGWWLVLLPSACLFVCLLLDDMNYLFWGILFGVYAGVLFICFFFLFFYRKEIV